MKWLITLLIIVQAPFLFIAFIAGGTDGKMSSLVSVWAIVIPIAACGAYTLYRLHFSSSATPYDKIATLVACSPIFLLLLSGIKNKFL
jgi:hypothetical protein